MTQITQRIVELVEVLPPVEQQKILDSIEKLLQLSGLTSFENSIRRSGKTVPEQPLTMQEIVEEVQQARKERREAQKRRS